MSNSYLNETYLRVLTNISSLRDEILNNPPIITEEEKKDYIAYPNKPHEKLGVIARQLCYAFDGWVVGGAVDFISGISQKKPKDIDIVISIEQWRHAALLIPEYSVSNKFGGFKFKDGDFILDVWQDNIGSIALNYENFKAYYPKRNIKIGRI